MNCYCIFAVPISDHTFLWSDFLQTIDARFAGILLCPYVCRAGLEEVSFKKSHFTISFIVCYRKLHIWRMVKWWYFKLQGLIKRLGTNVSGIPEVEVMDVMMHTYL